MSAMTLEQVSYHLREKKTTADDLLADAIDAHLTDHVNMVDKLSKQELAIEATLKLADSLSDIAKSGAGFYPDWGSRVLQAVQPLRDIGEFHNQTLEHNKILLEANSEFIKERTVMVKKVREVAADIEGSRGDEEDLYWFGRWSDQLRHAIGDKP